MNTPFFLANSKFMLSKRFCMERIVYMRRRDFLWYTLAAKVKKEMEKACQWVDPCTSGAPGWSKYRTQCVESVLYSHVKDKT